MTHVEVEIAGRPRMPAQGRTAGSAAAALPRPGERAVARAGGLWLASGRDPMAELVRAQRLASAMARARGLDPDAPRNLTRSIVLDRV